MASAAFGPLYASGRNEYSDVGKQKLVKVRLDKLARTDKRFPDETEANRERKLIINGRIKTVAAGNSAASGDKAGN